MAARPRLDALQRALSSVPPGSLSAAQAERITALLAAVWADLRGSAATAMRGRKLVGRTEELTWTPPVLAFLIERHGGTAHGSTRAQLQRWHVDVTTGEAMLQETGRYRQVTTRATAVRVGPLAQELAEAITHQQAHAALKWSSPTRVQVLVSRVEGLNAGVAQTVAGRRKRLIAALDQQVAARGWERLSVPGRYIYDHIPVQDEPGSPR